MGKQVQRAVPKDPRPLYPRPDRAWIKRDPRGIKFGADYADRDPITWDYHYLYVLTIIYDLKYPYTWKGRKAGESTAKRELAGVDDMVILALWIRALFPQWALVERPVEVRVMSHVELEHAASHGEASMWFPPLVEVSS